MEATNYTSIGPVLQLNKAGELTQKRIKAVKVCDGLFISEPDKTQFVKMIIEYNGVMWVEHTMLAKHANPELLAKRMPAVLKTIEDGKLAAMNEYRQEINRRIFSPDSPAIMGLKKPERKKPAPLAENERKVSVLMFKGCTNEMTEKKVVITEVAPHIYTYAYKLKRYGERVKVIFEIDGVYFQGSDNGAYVLEREDFTEVCTKAYEHARKNVAEGAAKGMAYFIEVQKRIDASTPSETPQISTETAETVNVSAEGEKEAERHEITLHSREQVLAYLDKLHSLEYDAGEVAYFKDGCTAEEHEDGAIWYVYPDAESDEVIQTLRIALQSPEAPQTVECTAEPLKLAQTA